MIAGLDSSIARPTPAQARAARAAGVRVWGGYLPPGAGLESPWDLASFQVVQEAGLIAVGFASGNDDPDQVAATARAWRVLGCLDDEDGIRRPGGWEQAWLDASGFGLYGLVGIHAALRARFHIAALYPGVDPRSSWPDAVAPRPPAPCGWQWQGTHDDPVTGLSVDSLWLDDWFGGIMLDPTDPIVIEIRRQLQDLHTGWDTQQGELQSLLSGQATAQAELATLQAAVVALQAAGVPPATLQPVLDSLARLGAHLGVGTA